MYKFLKKAIAAGIVFGSLSLGTVQAMPPTMPADQLVPGMTGTGYTVFDVSGEIQPFQVEVVGITDSGKGADLRIMARASGPQVEKSRGVLQGMSGSPIYIDGSLVGALSYGNAVDSYTFFITPIGDMMTLWNYPDEKNLTRIKNIDLKKLAEEKEKAKETEAKAAEGEDAEVEETEAKMVEAEEAEAKGTEAKDAKAEAEAEDVSQAEEPLKEASENEAEKATDDKAEKVAEKDTAAKTVAEEPALQEETPKPQADGEMGEPKAVMYFGGFNRESMAFLKKNVTAIDWNGMRPMTSASSGEVHTTNYQATLEPGSPVGVALVCGDFFVGATGTVTAVEGNKILAFGHPFMHRGNVNYFMTDASAVGTIGGYGSGMRVANPGSIIGRINQDREYGVSGIIGTYPSVVPMKVSIMGSSQQFTDQTFHSSIAYDEAVLPQLSAGVAYASMTRAADREGAGTAKVHFVIRTDAVDEGKVERSNMFYNLTDVGQVAVQELAQALNIICTNTEREADILDVQVEVSLDNARKTASLISAVPEKMKVKPGETVNIKTTIQPYRQQRETVTIPYTVPKAQREGALHLDVRGGGFVPMTPLLLLQQQGLDTSAEEDKTQTMKDKLRELTTAGMNNEIIIAPGASGTLLSEKEQKKAVREAARASARKGKQAAEREVKLLGGANGQNKPNEAKASTEYIIDNVIHTTLQVERK